MIKKSLRWQQMGTAMLAAGILLLAAFALGQQKPDLKTAEDLFAAGKWKDAREAYEKVLVAPGDQISVPEVSLKLGVCWEREGDWQKAIDIYRKILALKELTDPDRARVQLRMGYSMRRDGHDREAIPFLLAAAESEEADPNIRAEGYLYTAWAYGVLGEPEKALPVFRKVETVPKAHRNYAATAYLNIGRQLQTRERYEEAIAAFKKIAEFNPVAATNRSRARIYILECEALLAGDNPFHIKPCVVGVTGTTARLFWVSQGESPPAGEIVLTGIGQEVRRIPATTRPIASTICRRHGAELSELSPGTEYRYEVACGEDKVAGSFRTAPPPGKGFAFSVIGDTQSYHEDLQPLLDALGEEKTDFVIHVGDLVDKGDVWGEWKAGFFDPGWSYLRHSILRPTIGNHDGGPFYPAFFKTPEGKIRYSFDWGDAHFVVLDSYGAGSGGAGRAEQLAWLEKDLAANRKPWTIVSLHVPMVATRGSIKWFGKDDFLPLLEKHGVDLVFSGHHPLYRRYRPIGDRAILHVTSGGGGGPIGGFVPSPLLIKGVNLNHTCRVEVAEDRLRLTATSIEGEVIDRFELKREGGGDWRESRRPQIAGTGLAGGILSLYQELLTDRTFQLVLGAESLPAGGEKTVLTLDLSKLPRGKLDTSRLPGGARLNLSSAPESAWKIEPQDFSLAGGLLKIEATAPADAGNAGGRLTPGAEVTIELRVGEKRFEPYSAKTRLVLPGEP